MSHPPVPRRQETTLSVVPDDAPLGTVPRRTTCHTPDGRAWELVLDSAGVTVTSVRATIAEAHVQERDGRTSIELWVGGRDLPDQLSAQLVACAFAHPKVRAREPLLISLPRRNGGLLRCALERVDDAHTHAAGASCIVEGLARPPSSGLPRQRSR